MSRRVAVGSAVLSVLLAMGGMGLIVRAGSLPPTGIVASPAPARGEAASQEGGGRRQAPSAAVGPGLNLVTSGTDGVVLDLYTPEFALQRDGLCEQVVVDGYPSTDRAGWPRLPVRGAMVGVPPTGTVTLTVLALETVPLEGSHTICPVPRPIVELTPAGEARYEGMETLRDPQAYGSDALYPSTPVVLVSTGFVRSQRVAQLQFHPFQVDSLTGQLLLA